VRERKWCCNNARLTEVGDARGFRFDVVGDKEQGADLRDQCLHGVGSTPASPSTKMPALLIRTPIIPGGGEGGGRGSGCWRRARWPGGKDAWAATAVLRGQGGREGGSDFDFRADKISGHVSYIKI
jgi:hypothetical protein